MIIHLIIMCVLILLGSIVATFFAPQPVAHGLHQYHHHHKTWNCKPPYTTLYVYTQPVQRECVELFHNGKIVQAQDNSAK